MPYFEPNLWAPRSNSCSRRSALCKVIHLAVWRN